VSGLRFAYLLALCVWIGGLVGLALAAPVVFTVLPAHVPDTGRTLAGLVFGTLLARHHDMAYASAAIMLVSLLAMGLVGPRPRPYAPRYAVILAMLALTLVVDLVIGTRIAAMQAEIGVPVATLAADDLRRVVFGRWHTAANALMVVTLAGGLVLIFWEARTR
jgi:hypothetical protein